MTLQEVKKIIESRSCPICDDSCPVGNLCSIYVKKGLKNISFDDPELLKSIYQEEKQ